MPSLLSLWEEVIKMDNTILTESDIDEYTNEELLDLTSICIKEIKNRSLKIPHIEESEKQDVAICETGEGKTFDNPIIRKFDILKFIQENGRTKEYVKEQKTVGKNPNSQWDMGYDAALSLLSEEFIGD